MDFCYESFYASVSRNGFAIHLKCAPKTISDRAHRKQHEHLDVHIGVTGVAILHDELQSRGALITKPLEDRPWSCKDFYVEDADGYIQRTDGPVLPITDFRVDTRPVMPN